MVPRAALSSDSHWAAGPPRSNVTAHLVTLVSGTGAVCAHVCAAAGPVHTAGLPANQQQDGDLPHLVLCTWLPPSAAPGVGSAFTPQGKPSLLRELCNKIKSNNNPQPSPVQSDRQVLLWGHSSRYPGERRDVTCGAWWLQIALSDQQGPGRSQGRVSGAEGSRGIWSQQGMSSPESPGLVNGCSSVTMPGPNTRASGTRRGPGATQTSAKVWAPSPAPLATHLALQLLDELLQPVDLCHPLAVVFDTNTCTGKGRVGIKKPLSQQKLA